MKLVLAATAALLLSSAVASATCGDKGGPGYRGTDGQCKSWPNRAAECGGDLSRCVKEHGHPSAPDIARKQQKEDDDAEDEADRLDPMGYHH
jgi:hypothetical protein